MPPLPSGYFCTTLKFAVSCLKVNPDIVCVITNTHVVIVNII
jgi:hypothetical protein